MEFLGNTSTPARFEKNPPPSKKKQIQSTISFQRDKGDNPFKDTTIEDPLAAIFDPNEEEKKKMVHEVEGGEKEE